MDFFAGKGPDKLNKNFRKYVSDFAKFEIGKLNFGSAVNPISEQVHFRLGEINRL